MANPYRVTIRSISTDGTNYYVELEIFDGLHQLPTIRPAFDASTADTDIQAYVQNIANAQPTLPLAIQNLVGQIIIGQ
jgi:hypothetical protein